MYLYKEKKYDKEHFINISHNYQKILDLIEGYPKKPIATAKDTQKIQLVVVSKQKSVEEIEAIYKSGCRVFAENYVQEFIAKQKVLPQDISWHFIGHLQTNKVKYIVGNVDIIHSVDSIRLLNEINKRAATLKIVQKVLVEVNIGREKSKSGIYTEDAISFFEQATSLQSIEIVGLMAIPPNGTLDKTRSYFKELNLLKSNIEQHSNTKHLELSMGMSDDFLIAIEEGSTIVRIGSAIFGNRS